MRLFPAPRYARTLQGLVGLALAAVGALGPQPVQAAPQSSPLPPSASPAPVAEPVTHPSAIIETTKGTIRIELYTDQAPITAGNFIALTRRHFYDGLTFHRVVPGFVIQGGDPLGTGEGGSDKTIPLEIGEGLSHDAAGVVAMARDSNPDSASCQYYITLAPVTRLDGKYAVFGRVTQGLDVVKRIAVGDRMITVTMAP